MRAAADSNFEKLGLELGGKNPIVVFADSDLEDAADGAAFGISFNTGQCCVSSSRLIVERSVAAEFEEILAAATSYFQTPIALISMPSIAMVIERV